MRANGAQDLGIWHCLGQWCDNVQCTRAGFTERSRDTQRGLGGGGSRPENDYCQIQIRIQIQIQIQVR